MVWMIWLMRSTNEMDFSFHSTAWENNQPVLLKIKFWQTRRDTTIQSIIDQQTSKKLGNNDYFKRKRMNANPSLFKVPRKSSYLFFFKKWQITRFWSCIIRRVHGRRETVSLLLVWTRKRKSKQGKKLFFKTFWSF